MAALLAACRTAHAMLALAAAVLGYTTAAAAAPGFILAAVLTIPVLVAASGVWHGRTRTLRGFAVLLVAYIGLGTVEVLATGGRFVASVFLGAAVAEFTLLLILLRRPPATALHE